MLASIFCGHNASLLVVSVEKRHYGGSWFREEFIEVPNSGIIPKEWNGKERKRLTSHLSLSMKISLRLRKIV